MRAFPNLQIILAAGEFGPVESMLQRVRDRLELLTNQKMPRVTIRVKAFNEKQAREYMSKRLLHIDDPRMAEERDAIWTLLTQVKNAYGVWHFRWLQLVLGTYYPPLSEEGLTDANIAKWKKSIRSDLDYDYDRLPY